MSFFDRGWMRYPKECAFGISLILIALFLGANLYFGENPTSVVYQLAYPYIYSHIGFGVMHFAVAMLAVFGIFAGISAYEGERIAGSVYLPQEEDRSGRIVIPALILYVLAFPFVTCAVMSWNRLPDSFEIETAYPFISTTWPIILLPSGLAFIAHSVRIYRW